MRSMKQEPVGLYLHFPFCVRKCRYCDFLSGPADEAVRRAYADAMRREIRTAGETAAAGADKITVDTIFLGGGTPSVMDPSDLARVMETVREVFDVLPDAEITMEMNPGTFREDLLDFVGTYINRVSLGLQSADDGELRELGRIHTFAEFEKCMSALRNIGIRNRNVDLMSAIPHQTSASWEKTLRKAAGLGPEHLSCYSLIIEEGTPFFELHEAGKLALPDENAEREMYYMTERVLAEYGYARYEISNYAKPGYACRHNVRYWKRSPYIGFGIGAASLFDETRWSNTRDLAFYLDHCGDLTAIREDVGILTEEERMEEFMFLGLRMTEGVFVSDFRRKFGRELGEVFGDALFDLASRGLVTREGDRIRLTPYGTDVSNVVLSEFLL